MNMGGCSCAEYDLSKLKSCSKNEMTIQVGI